MWLLAAICLAMSWSALNPEVIKARWGFAKVARRDLITYARLMTPDPFDPLDARKSKYQWKPLHRLVADELQRIEAGQLQALEIEMPPRYGKSEVAVRNFVSWYAGKHPQHDQIIVTATAELAVEHGRDVRDYMRSPGYRLVFGSTPDSFLREDSQSASRLQMRGGGKLHFYGRGQIPAGVGAYGITFDDFFKSAEEAYSDIERDKAFRNYAADCLSRLNNAAAWQVMIGSRKHMDDVQGRVFDPLNQHYDEGMAAKFKRIRIPALSEGEGDPLGRPVDEVCWPERFPQAFYLAKRNHKSDIFRIDFQTQDQCRPLPEEGNYFKKKWIKRYKPDELPKHLEIYVASDHAYRAKQLNDLHCLLVVGIDPTDTIWVLPDTWWQRAETDVLVEAMIGLMRSRKPVTWFAARDAISGSVGPFLHKRMREEKVFTWVNDELREDVDLVRRARSIQGRMAMGCVLFPDAWPQMGDAEKQLLEFPNGGKDDLVAALAVLGMALDRLQAARGPDNKPENKPGTLAWVKNQQLLSEADAAAKAALKGW